MVEQFALPKSVVDIHNHVKPEDARGDQLIGQMDAAGVEMALIMGSPMNPNEDVAKAMAEHPGRFVGGAYLDPRAPDACEQLDHWVRRGLRISHPGRFELIARTFGDMPFIFAHKQAELLQRSAKALTGMGMADSFEKIYSTSARTVLQKAGAINRPGSEE